MFNGSEETNIILQDTLLTGITDVSFDYQVEEEAVLLLANRGINRKINKASSASCSISKKCIGRDFIQELTGYANLSGQFIYGTGGLDFDQATITNYKISLSPQDIPTLSADLKIYGDLKPAAGLRLNSSYTDNSGENFDPTSIVFNLDDTISAVTRFSYSVDFDSKPTYEIESVKSSSSKILTPIKYSVSADIEMIEQEFENMTGLLQNEEFNRDVSFSLIDNSGVVLNSFSVPNASLKSQKISATPSDTIQVSLDYVGYGLNIPTGVAPSYSYYITPEIILDAAANIDTAISGKNVDDNFRIFTSQDHSTDTFTRNTDVWCSNIDITCISPSNSNDNHRKAGTLITPRHILNAAHYEYGVGTKVYFVSQDGNNTVYERTVVSKVRHPDYSPYYPDFTVYCLDSDLPSDKVAPCKVLPSNYATYLSNQDLNQFRPPTLCLDQEEKAIITNLLALSSMSSFAAPTDATRLLFYESKIMGDSGNPAFLILDLGNGPELILLTVWTYGGAGSGTNIGNQISQLNAMIVTSDSQAGNGGTGYTLTEADLSLFNT
jgi:hypothetical protein